jgi:hypothetical protein
MSVSSAAVRLRSNGLISLFLMALISVLAGMPNPGPAFSMEINQSETSECPQVTSAFSCGGNDVWGASIFTPSENSILSEVETHFLQNNSSYEIRIYDKFSSGSFSSQLGDTVTGSVTEAGYYNIPLPTPIPLQAGNSVAIVVKFTTPLPMEGSAAAAGTSYFSCDGSYFMDTKTYLDPGSIVGINRVVFTDTDGDGIPDDYDPCPSAKPVRILGTSRYFTSLQAAMDEPNLANGNVIGCHNVQFAGPLVYDRDGKTVTLRGGYDCSYSVCSTETWISDSLTIKSGTVIAENIVIY